MRLFGKSLVAVLIALFPGISRGQNPDFHAEKVVRDSVNLYDYPGPVRIRMIDGFGGAYVMGRPFVPALLCADSIKEGGQLDCYEARTKKEVFFDDPQAEFVDLEGGHQAVIFSANLNYSGSGWSWLWSLLVLDHDGLWKNLFPDIISSNQSDHLFWHSPSLSPYGVFTVADFIWGKAETHFSSHRYRVQSYEYCQKAGKYALADDFVTAKKFPGLDDVDRLDVIHPELGEIERRMDRKSLAACR